MIKQGRIHYIYKTTCTVTDRWYIGMHSTNNLDDGYMGSGKRLKTSINKHGKENHTKEILSYYDNRELLVEAEIKAITLNMLKDRDCMNIMMGGDGGFISDEHQRHYSVCGGLATSKRIKEDKEYAKWHAEIASKTMTRTHKEGKFTYGNFKGKTHSKETKNLMSESSKGMGKGKANSQYGTCWITNGTESKKIKKEDLETYTNDGWVKGRKM